MGSKERILKVETETESEAETETEKAVCEKEAASKVKHLAEQGAAVTADPSVPCKRYFHSGNEMVRVAKVYLKEGNLESAYVLYIKFMTLFIEKIRKHPEYSDVSSQLKLSNQAKLKEVIPEAEELKLRLLQKYRREILTNIRAEKERTKREEERLKKLKKQEEQDEKLAESLQQDELRKYNESIDSVLHRPSAPVLSDAMNVNVPNIDDILYPDDFATEPLRLAPGSQESSFPPPIIRQTKPNVWNIMSDSLSDSSQSLVSSNSLLGSSSLRTVIVPSLLMEQFLKLATLNTKKNIETCGILAGTLERDTLIITHMILPKQNGTPDSCTTRNEEEIFQCQDQYNLITLGWIHTHPTQTAFLSSVDLHTQCSYQLMMPEAIAIVCAPKYNETGFFGLTPHYGMSFIANCHQSGFHPHPNDPPLFKEVSHIKLDNNSRLQIIDLRI